MAKILKKGALVGLGLVFFLVFYPIKVARYFYEKLFVMTVTTHIGFGEVFAETFCTVEEALKLMLPEAQDIKEDIKVLTEDQKKAISKAAGIEFDPEFDKEFHFYTSSSAKAVLATVKGKWGPIKFMMSFDAQAKIKDLIVLELKEKRGRPVKERKFLEQYIGKSTADPIKLKKDIKGISGATISSRQMTDEVRKLVYIYEELYRK